MSDNMQHAGLVGHCDVVKRQMMMLKIETKIVYASERLLIFNELPQKCVLLQHILVLHQK